MKIKFIISITGVLVLFLASCSPSTEELYTKCDKLIDQKRYAKAIEVYDKIIKRNPKLQDAWYNKGYCYLLDSNYTKALDLFNTVLRMKGINDKTSFEIEMNPNSPFATEEDKHQIPVSELYYQIGITKYYMDSLTASYKNFQYCIDRNYQKGNCFSWQGLIWISVDSAKKGCLFLEKAKSLGDTDADKLIKSYCQNKPEK